MTSQKNVQKIVKILALSLLFWAPAIIFLKIAGEIIEREPLAIDRAILEYLHSFATPVLDQIFIFITDFGGVIGIVSISLLLIAYFLFKKRRRDAVFLAVSVAGASLTNVILKSLFSRDRPSLWHQAIVEKGFSFPSGHAMASAALVACLIFIYWKTKNKWLVLALGSIAVLLIGVSRMYLGVHYPSDVVAGWCVSVVWVCIAFYITRLSFSPQKKD